MASMGCSCALINGVWSGIVWRVMGARCALGSMGHWVTMGLYRVASCCHGLVWACMGL